MKINVERGGYITNINSFDVEEKRTFWYANVVCSETSKYIKEKSSKKYDTVTIIYF